MAREKPSLIVREREYHIEQLALARALQSAPRTAGNAHLHTPHAAWGGRTWVEWIIEQYGHLAADLVNRAVKRGEQQRMFGEDGGVFAGGKGVPPFKIQKVWQETVLSEIGFYCARDEYQGGTNR